MHIVFVLLIREAWSESVQLVDLIEPAAESRRGVLFQEIVLMGLMVMNLNHAKQQVKISLNLHDISAALQR